jgi:hypothetical protein
MLCSHVAEFVNNLRGPLALAAAGLLLKEEIALGLEGGGHQVLGIIAGKNLNGF